MEAKARWKRACEKIEASFMEALQSRELHEISVSALCKQAGVNRSTFYANYLDVYDLADQVREHLEREVERLYEAEIAGRYSSNDFLRLLRHIRDNQPFYRTYFKLGYDNQNRALHYDENEARKYFGDRNVAYHVEFFISGFNAIVKLWLKNGCQETPEEMDEILRSEYQGRTFP